MGRTEIPAYVVWIVGGIAVVIAGVLLMNATSPSTVEGGRVSPQDAAVLQQMQQVRQQSGTGAGRVPQLQPATSPPAEAGGR